MTLPYLFPAFSPGKEKLDAIRKISGIFSSIFILLTILFILFTYKTYVAISFKYISYIYDTLSFFIIMYMVLIYKAGMKKVYILLSLLTTTGILITVSSILTFSIAGEFGNLVTPLHIITFALLLLGMLVFSASYMKTIMQKDAISKALLTFSHEALIFFVLFFLAFPVISLKFASHLFLSPSLTIFFFVLLLFCAFCAYIFSQRHAYTKECIAITLLVILSITFLAYIQYPYIIYPILTVFQKEQALQPAYLCIFGITACIISVYGAHKLLRFGKV